MHAHAPYTLVAATRFKHPAVQNIIHHLKYKHEKRLARFCGELVAESVSRYFKTFPTELTSALVVPVPLHPRRLRERGFNQSEEIAKCFLEKSGYPIPLNTAALLRTKHATAQVRQSSREERLLNLRGSFSVADPEAVRNKTILVIDDVSTTGATLLETTTALRNAGARRVIAFVIAKTD